MPNNQSTNLPQKVAIYSIQLNTFFWQFILTVYIPSYCSMDDPKLLQFPTEHLCVLHCSGSTHHSADEPADLHIQRDFRGQPTVVYVPAMEQGNSLVFTYKGTFRDSLRLYMCQPWNKVTKWSLHTRGRCATVYCFTVMAQGNAFIFTYKGTFGDSSFLYLNQLRNKVQNVYS